MPYIARTFLEHKDNTRFLWAYKNVKGFSMYTILFLHAENLTNFILELRLIINYCSQGPGETY